VQQSNQADKDTHPPAIWKTSERKRDLSITRNGRRSPILRLCNPSRLPTTSARMPSENSITPPHEHHI
jgi:hypothetical protein